MCLLFSSLNVIELSSHLGLLLSFMCYFSVVCLLENKIELDSIKSNVFLLSFVMVVFILTIIMAGRGADKIITKIGLGFEECCYLYGDMIQYNIPEQYVSRKNDTVLSIFVLSNVSNEMHIGYKKKINLVYSFKYEKLTKYLVMIIINNKTNNLATVMFFILNQDITLHCRLIFKYPRLYYSHK